jgi:hypothetical protein
VTGVYNFNIWDLAESFESADPRYQLAVIVAHMLMYYAITPGPLALPASSWSTTPIVSHLYFGMTPKWSSLPTW